MTTTTNHPLVDLINETLQEQEEETGLSRVFSRNELPGVMLSPVVDVANAFKKFGARVGLRTVGMVVSTFEQLIAATTPFNDPRMVDYVAAQYRAWEHKHMEFIDRQFEKETARMRQGWETFKTDFWGLGFVASPFGAVAAALTAGKSLDAALSVLNVVTGGYMQRYLDRVLNAKPRDPGSVRRYFASLENPRNDSEYHDYYGDYIDESASQGGSLGASVEALRKEMGEDKANKFLTSLAQKTLKDDRAKKLESKWVQQNLPGVVGGILSSAEQAIDKVEPGKSQTLKANAGKAARVLVRAASKTVSPEALKAVETSLQQRQ